MINLSIHRRFSGLLDSEKPAAVCLNNYQGTSG